MELEALKALADENRLRIVMLLANGEQCICDLAAALDESDALISHHVKQLREAGLIKTRRAGRWLVCALEPSAFDLLAQRMSELAARAAEAAVLPSSRCCAAPAGYPTVKEEIWP